jgi:hypothetical protein
MPRATLRTALTFASRDEVRPMLCGVHVDLATGTVSATDSYRLVQARGVATVLDIDEETGHASSGASSGEVILPHEALKPHGTASRPPSRPTDIVSCLVDGTSVIVSSSGKPDTTDKLIDAQYPHVERLFPADDDEMGHLRFEGFGSTPSRREHFAAVLTTLARDKNLATTPVVLHVDEAQNVETSWRGLRGPALGVTADKVEPGDYAYNPSFLLDLLTVGVSPTLKAVEMAVRTSLKPAVLHAGADRRLLMPMRIS